MDHTRMPSSVQNSLQFCSSNKLQPLQNLSGISKIIRPIQTLENPFAWVLPTAKKQDLTTTTILPKHTSQGCLCVHMYTNPRPPTCETEKYSIPKLLPLDWLVGYKEIQSIRKILSYLEEPVLLPKLLVLLYMWFVVVDKVDIDQIPSSVLLATHRHNLEALNHFLQPHHGAQIVWFGTHLSDLLRN